MRRCVLRTDKRIVIPLSQGKRTLAAVPSLLPRAPRVVGRVGQAAQDGVGVSPRTSLVDDAPPDSSFACAHEEPPSPPLALARGGREKRERSHNGLHRRCPPSSRER